MRRYILVELVVGCLSLVVGTLQEGLEQFGDAGSVHVESNCRQYRLSGARGRRASDQDEQSLEAGVWLVAQLTFPKAQHEYSVCAQRFCCLGISLLVAGQFLAPVWSVCLGRVAVFGASMPEASVDEYGYTLDCEEEVRAPWQGRDVHLPATSPEADQ